MKPLSLLFLGVVVGWTASGVDWSREAIGQNAAQSPEPSGIGAVSPELQQRIGEWRKEATEYSQINRYQISAYGTQTGHGCFVVDTSTGKVWQVGSGKPIVVVSELPEK